MSTGRAEAFSDGVFAIAITLLVLSLRLPGQGSLTSQLLAAWPQYFAYVVSFLTIGIMWMNHHTILAHVARVDRPLLVLNLLLLMGVVAIPFPTSLVADNLISAQNGTAAVVTYGLVMIAISFGFSGLWIYVATHAQALGAAVPPEALRQSIPGFTAGLVAYVVATLIALFSPVAALIIFGVLAVYYLFDHLPSPAGEGPEVVPGGAGPGL
jgi:TMEM175 potassium channel family protein